MKSQVKTYHVGYGKNPLKTNQRILVLEHDGFSLKSLFDYQFDGVLNLGRKNWEFVIGRMKLVFI